MATSGLYGSSPTGVTVAAPGSETSGLYGNGTTFGGTYFEWFIFIQSATQPATPTGGSWSFTTNVGTPPSGWSLTPPSAPTLPVWGSIALVNSANSASLTWSAPGLFAYAQGLPVLSGADIPLSGDGVNSQLYVQTGSTPQTIWFKESGTWTRLTGSTLYVDLVNNQTIGGTKTFSSQIQGSISGTSSNVTGVVAIANGGTGQATATNAINALLPSQTGNTGKYLTTDGSNTSWQPTTGAGTVTSVNVSGGTTGLTTSGGPITAAGTITLAGTLAIANGGTGSTSTTYANLASNVYGVLPVNNGGTGVTTSTGSGNNVLSTNASLTTPTQVTYENWTGISAPTYTEGRLWYDSAAHALAYYNDSANATVHIGQDLQVKVINNTGSTIANGAPVYITGTSSGQTYPNIALAKADVAATSSVIGLTNGSIANGAIGYVTSQGVIDGVNTGTFTVGQVLYLSPYSAGQLMNTIPPTGITVQVGVVSYVDASAGKIYVKQTTPLAVPASIITGQVAIANGGTGQSTQAAAITALTGTQTSGYYLRSNGTNSVLSAIQVADVPTLNQNTTGTSANITATSNSTLTTLSALSLPTSQLTGTLGIGNGGTGQTTANAAFNALAPSQTSNSGKFLTTDGTNTSWATNPLGTVTSVAATVPSFLSITGSPITTSGTLAISYSGTALPTTSGGTGLTSFTANGVVYASSTSALTTGSALTFDGTKLVNTGYNKSSYQVSTGGVGTFESVGAAYLSYASGGNLYSMLNGSGAEDIFNYRASAHIYYIGGVEKARFDTSGNLNIVNLTASKVVFTDASKNLTSTGTVSVAQGGTGTSTPALVAGTNVTITGTWPNQTINSSNFGGTVTSVSGTGTVNGLTLTGTVTTSGSLTLGGTLSGIANSALTNSSITIGGTTISLGGSSNTLANDITIYGVTVGRGAGAVSTNTALGNGVLSSNTTGLAGVGVGYLALSANTTGSFNVAMGRNSLIANTTADGNTALGDLTLTSNTTGASNVAVGRQALQANTTASNNTAVGYQAGYSNTTGAENTYMGRLVGYTNTTSGFNTGFGSQALYGNTGAQNSAYGYASLVSNSSGASNTALGSQSLYSNTTASGNTAVGYQAGYTNTTGNFSAVGYQALYSNTTGYSNSAFGATALRTNTTGLSNSAVGEGALYSNTTASNNTAVGYQAGYLNTTGQIDAFGSLALRANTTGNYSVAFGNQALTANTTGNDNSALGFGALFSNTTGSSNTAIGRAALLSNTTASNNTAVGYQAGYSNTTGANNTVVGFQSLYTNTTGLINTAVGNYALYSNTTGGYNVAVGGGQVSNVQAALFSNTTGQFNVAVGTGSLYSNTTASQNTALGYQAGYSNTASNNVFLAAYSGYSTTTGTQNSFVGRTAGYANTTGSLNTYVGDNAGYYTTTGSKNTIIGGYNGNQGGLDIRTSSGYVVLSDGDGNPLVKVQNNASLALQGAGVVGGIGISFPATQSASSDANTLDDYEEGTWTPKLSDGTNTVDGTTTCKYRKVGGLVYVEFEFYNKNISGFSGGMRLSNLPFANASASTWGCCVGSTLLTNPIYFNGSNGNTYMILNLTFSTSDSVALQKTAFTSQTNMSVWGQFCYTAT